MTLVVVAVKDQLSAKSEALRRPRAHKKLKLEGAELLALYARSAAPAPVRPPIAAQEGEGLQTRGVVG